MTFLSTKRTRLLMITAFVLVFNYLGNVTGFALASLERYFKQWKRRWLSKHEPYVLADVTAW